MEWFAFVGIVIVVVVFALWRGRSRTPVDDNSPMQGLPDDLRDKNAGQVSLPNDGHPWPGGH